MHLENVSMAQIFNESSIASLASVSESFDNSMQQVEHFYSPLCISKVQVHVQTKCLKMDNLSHFKVRCVILPLFKCNILHLDV